MDADKGREFDRGFHGWSRSGFFFIRVYPCPSVSIRGSNLLPLALDAAAGVAFGEGFDFVQCYAVVIA